LQYRFSRIISCLSIIRLDKHLSHQEKAMIRFDPTALSQPVDALAEAIRADADAPALVAQVTRGSLSATIADGVSDLATGTPANAQQTFEIGSQTKMMTAVMVLQLMEEGKIDLDAPAAQYLPAETIAGVANADTATVRQLLDMTSGIGNYTDAVGPDGIPLFIAALQANPDAAFGPADALDIARGMEPTNAPGEGYFYSNTNYLLLGQLIETVTGEPYFDALQDRVLTPLGMADTSPQLASSDPRLSSYITDAGTGETIDVTNAQWETRGESGVVSTTADMTTFLRGLLVDKTLLGVAALAEMMDFQNPEAGVGGASDFGLGLVRIILDDGTTAIGFTGGTLGTASSTYLDIGTGTIISTAGTSPDLDSASAALALLKTVTTDANWAPAADDSGPVSVTGISAADVDVQQDGSDMTFIAGSSELTLERTLKAQTTSTVTFEDASVMVVGDNRAGTRQDDRANTIDIARDFAAANSKDNLVLGLGGDDRLLGGAGNDRLVGGSGHDRLIGRNGNDRLEGGQGHDQLNGGSGNDILSGDAGRDVLLGGAGADTFVFLAPGDSPAGRHADRIGDFVSGVDKIDLSAIGIGTANGDFTWLATEGFSGQAGELRYQPERDGVRVLADIDGDGLTDMAFTMTGATQIVASDFIL
jgi:D-alanyl-D-alanine carboxypeptidase